MNTLVFIKVLFVLFVVFIAVYSTYGLGKKDSVKEEKLFGEKVISKNKIGYMSVSSQGYSAVYEVHTNKGIRYYAVECITLHSERKPKVVYLENKPNYVYTELPVAYYRDVPW